MKKTIAILCGALIGLGASAQGAQLVVQKVDNQGLVPGNTYRVYVHILDAGKNVHAIFGDIQNPLAIQSTAPFYQSPMGSYSSINVMPEILAIAPEMNYDSWITLGFADADGNDMWDIGMSFVNFDGGGSITTDNGAWFLLPTDAKCEPNENGLILIAQLTTTGVASGTLNIQGWDGPNNNWQARNLMFTTAEYDVFGCTASNASNYNAAATFDDGTCAFNSNTGIVAENGHDGAVRTDGTVNGWDVFPNPVRQNTLHIQFKNTPDLSAGNATVEIFDMAGKRVNRYELTQSMMSSGNRVTLQQALSGGTYKVVLTNGGVTESKSIIVER